MKLKKTANDKKRIIEVTDNDQFSFMESKLTEINRNYW